MAQVLTEASEFDELPVRHNEDRLNADMAGACRYPVDPKRMDDPHVKAHLLLQVSEPCVGGGAWLEGAGRPPPEMERWDSHGALRLSGTGAHAARQGGFASLCCGIPKQAHARARSSLRVGRQCVRRGAPFVQAHLSRQPLPITDYVTDTKSVLDNSLRVLQVCGWAVKGAGGPGGSGEERVCVSIA